jgi:transposase InsO family protein
VETHRDTFGVAPLLAAIGEPVSTFYNRSNREPSMRAVHDTALAERIEAIWERSHRTYGAPRMHAMLARGGIRVGRKRVERLMRQLGIQGAHLRKHWKTTRRDRDATAAPDLVDRNFCAGEPNRLWVADLERHEAFANPGGGGRPPLDACRSRRVEAGGRSIASAWGWLVEQSSTTTSRPSTARWGGLG